MVPKASSNGAVDYLSGQRREGKHTMDAGILLFLGISGLLVLTPPVAIWHALSKQASGRAAWLHPALALIGPLVLACVFLVLVWLPAYTGQCGGWLGETSPCTGFGQYVTETMFWAATSTAVPGLLGIVLGVGVLTVLLLRRALSRPRV